MKITDIKVFPVREEKLKAFVSIVLDECFMVNDIKVIRGKDGYFISMPSRRKRNGKFKDIAHPLNNETRRFMEDEILAAYEAAQGSGRSEPRSQPAPKPAPKPAHDPAPQVADSPRRQRPRREPRAESVPPAEQPESAGITESRPQAETAPPESPEPAPEEAKEGDKTLEEVTELHLRDSFWGT